MKLHYWLSVWLLTTSLSHAAPFIGFTDIHFNPFDECQLVTVKKCQFIMDLEQLPVSEWHAYFEAHSTHPAVTRSKDTNYALLKLSLAKIQETAAANPPLFYVMLGDFLAHEFRPQYILATHDTNRLAFEAFTQKTLAFLTEEIKAVTKTAPYFPVIGNNDTYTIDYQIEPKGKFLHDVALLWAPVVAPTQVHAFTEQFQQAGYAMVPLPTMPDVHVILLDSQLFSVKARGADPKDVENALRWLQQQLQHLKNSNQHAMILMHIPPGEDIYRNVVSLFKDNHPFWRKTSTDAFQEIITRFHDTVLFMIAGHIHNEIGYQTQWIGGVPLYYIPSISPIFQNHPGFKVFELDQDGRITKVKFVRV